MKIHYSMFLNTTGYSISAQDYVLAMKRVQPDIDIRCKFFNTGYIGVSANRQQIFVGMKSDAHKDCVDVYHSVPERYRRLPNSVKNIGICVFETINLPPRWTELMNRMDLIITASHFNKGVFRSNGVTVPIQVIPHCFDTKLFHRSVRPIGRFSQRTFVALGQWKQRKNWRTMIKGFYQAFKKNDNVCLLIKTDKPNRLEEVIRKIKMEGPWRSKDTCPIYVEKKHICSFEEIPSWMKKGDFYISTSLGEGFGLSGAHAMALGIPVITTRFGGCLEYARPENCTYINPIKYDRIQQMDNIPQFRNAIWPVITVDEVANKMREVVEHYPEEKTKKAYDFIHKNFSYEVIGKKFLEALYGI